MRAVTARRLVLAGLVVFWWGVGWMLAELFK
jgi:hypothetical protein